MLSVNGFFLLLMRYSRVLRYTSETKTSLTTSSSFASFAMVTHFPGIQHGRGRGARSLEGRGGRDIGEVPRGVYIPPSVRTQYFCTHCKKAGHTKSYSYTLHPELHLAHVAYAEVNESPPALEVTIESTLASAEQVTLSRATYDSLVSFVQMATAFATTVTLASRPLNSPSCLLSSTPDAWVIDYGVTNHMTGNSTLLSSFRFTPPTLSHPVTFVDGSQISITGAGTIIKSLFHFIPFYIYHTHRIICYLLVP